MSAAALFPPEIMLQTPSLQNNSSPKKIGDSIAPVVQASSVYAIDLNSGEPLYVQNIFEKRSIASITKLMTAMVILDSHTMDEVITVTSTAANIEGSRMFLRQGERIRLDDTIRGLLINSGNDAGLALAIYDAGNEKNFVKKMNAKARMLGLQDTNFANPIGFDHPDAYSTAYDVMHMALAAIQYPLIRETVSLKSATVRSVDAKYTHNLETTNDLLKDTNFKVVGLKTGTTEAAGESVTSILVAPNKH